MFSNAIQKLSVVAVVKAKQKGRMIAVAESCTGGLLAASLTHVSGSSAAFERGFVTYSNEAKMQDLGVEEALIQTHGAVSEEVANDMVRGLENKTQAQVFCSITGIAGPTGGSEEKPVGTVYIGIGQSQEEAIAKRFIFPGDRAQVREKTVETALRLLIEKI